MREAKIPKEGYIFRHKENKDLFAREIYLAEGESIDNYEQITEAEYEAIQDKIKAVEEVALGFET